MRRQHLDRHRAIERLVDRLEHDAHAARADDARDFIAAQPPEHRGIVRRTERVEHVLNRAAGGARCSGRKSASHSSPPAANRTRHGFSSRSASRQASGSAACCSKERRQLSHVFRCSVNSRSCRRRSSRRSGTIRAARDRRRLLCKFRFMIQPAPVLHRFAQPPHDAAAGRVDRADRLVELAAASSMLRFSMTVSSNARHVSGSTSPRTILAARK